MKRKAALPQSGMAIAGYTSMTGFKLKSIRSNKPRSASGSSTMTKVRSLPALSAASTQRRGSKKVSCFQQGIRDIVELTRENLPSKATEASEMGESRYTIHKNLIVRKSSKGSFR